MVFRPRLTHAATLLLFLNFLGSSLAYYLSPSPSPPPPPRHPPGQRTTALTIQYASPVTRVKHQNDNDPHPCSMERSKLLEEYKDTSAVPADNKKSKPTVLSRRMMMIMAQVVTAGTTLLPFFVFSRQQVQVAWAAPPITVDEAQNSVKARVKRAWRSNPVLMLRPRVNQDFAVLLMRSSYNVLDELDCVPMDQFQRDFFLIRQAEYQSYINALGGPGFVQQGDLTDPYYFDFISFAQYVAISREISQDPPLVFVEKKPVEGDVAVPAAAAVAPPPVAANESGGERGGETLQRFENVVIRRDPNVLPNDRLALEHSQRVGRRILDQFKEVYGNTPSALPPPPPPPAHDSIGTGDGQEQLVLEALQQLVKLFCLNGYALDGTASFRETVATTTATSKNQQKPIQLTLSLTSPTTLWGGQALWKERAAVTNHFLLKAASALVEQYGYEVVGSSIQYEGVREMNHLTIR